MKYARIFLELQPSLLLIFVLMQDQIPQMQKDYLEDLTWRP